MLNAAASTAAKRQGQQLAILFDGEWSVAVLIELRAWLEARRAAGETTMTFEQFRHDAIAQPHSHYGWGALPRLAQKAKLIAPLLREDGSQVMRPAASVKTHGHVVRLWTILVGASSSEATGARAASEIQAHGSEALRQPTGRDGRGDVLHGGDATNLLQATADYHRAREGQEVR